MNITVSEKAMTQLQEENAKDLRIFLKGYGWAGPSFGLAQVEPEENDKIFSVDGINFAIEEDIYDLVNSFEVDYYKGLFQKGYVVYANGSKGSC